MRAEEGRGGIPFHDHLMTAIARWALPGIVSRPAMAVAG
jgi:hypothetical protein